MKIFFLIWSSPNFGPKTGLNLSKDLFFDFQLNLGRKRDLVLDWKNFILVFIILKFSEFPAPPPFENPAYATGLGPLNFILRTNQKMPPATIFKWPPIQMGP